MKSLSLISRQDCAPLTYLRSPEKLARLFGDSPSVLIAAPAGSGRRTLVYQWLGSRAANAVWFYVAKPPSIPVAEARQWVSLTTLDAGLHLLIGKSADTLVIEIDELEPTRLQMLLPDLKCIHPRAQVIFLCERCNPAVYEALHRLEITVLGIDDVALDENEVKDLVQLLFGATAPSRLHHALFQYSQGWLPVVMEIIAEFMSQPFKDTAACEQQYRDIGKRAICRISADFNHHHMETIKIVSLLSRLPMALRREQDIDGALLKAAEDAIARGFLKFDFAVPHDHSVRCTVLARILVANHDISYHQSFSAMLELLLRRQLYDIAIPALLLAEQLEDAADAILEAGDRLIARFHMSNLLQWILALDSRVLISDLLILMMAVRCCFYQGNIHDVIRFMERLNNEMSAQALAHMRLRHGDKQYCRFISEYKLYCHALKQEPGTALDIAASRIIEGSGDHTIALLQSGLFHAEKGELSSAMPFLEAGIQLTEASQQIPMHLMFSVIYIWVLALSCRVNQAEQFVIKLRSTLSRNNVGYLGAYDWIDVMEVLLLRIRGDLELLDEKLERLLGSQVITADFQKNYLLLNVKADVCLLQGQLYEARHAISKLASLQAMTTRQSYWFASVQVMTLTASVLEERASPYLPPGIQTVYQSGAASSIAEQTEAIWMLKLCLYKRSEMNIDSILEKYHEQCTQNGQWIRVLELDILRAVCFYRRGRQQEGITLFEKAFIALEQSASLGVMLDPFLLWGEILSCPKSCSVRTRARELFCKVRPGHKFGDKKQARSLLPEQLSRREQQVLELMVEGKSSTEIADLLCISITTVRTHTQNIYRKLEVTSRAEAVVTAIRLKLVDMA